MRPFRLLAALLALAAAPAVMAQSQTPRAFTPRDLAELERVGETRVSPDGRWAAYGLRTTDYQANRGVNHLYLADLRSGAAPRRLAASAGGASSPRWSADGGLYFLSSRSGSSQVWRTDAGGARATQVTRLPLDVQAFRLSPDGRRMAVALAVYPSCARGGSGDEIGCTVQTQKAKGGTKASGLVFDQVFVRHWDTWADGTRNHLFVLPISGTGTPVAIMPGFDGDSPTKPFGDDADFTFSRNGESVIFTARLAGRTEPWSTNFDLWQAPADGSRPPVNLTAANPAWDAAPAVSPDGRSLAWLAMDRPGFEADQFDIMIRDLATGRVREVTGAWDRSPDHIAWSPDGRTLYASAGDVGQTRIFAVDAATGRVAPLTGQGQVTGMDVGPDGLVYTQASLAGPAQLYRVGFDGTGRTQLTRHNAERLRGVQLGEFEQFSFPGWNGERVHGYVMKPAGYREGQRYPVAFLIHGGPQSSFGNAWSYRWNPQTYAGAGYGVVFIDFHGSTGYGQAFTDSITGHWGDRPLEDLQKGWAAALSRYPWLDGERACALGASYGGYMTNWIAGVWPDPWRCLVTHAGIYDTRSMGAATEELWFTEWEFGGTPWDNPEAYERFNPRNHVQNWRTPMLVTQGERDFRVIGEQSLAAFNTLQRRGIDSRLVWFPDENHWILKPQNSVQWHEEVGRWLDRHTGGGGMPGRRGLPPPRGRSGAIRTSTPPTMRQTGMPVEGGAATERLTASTNPAAASEAVFAPAPDLYARPPAGPVQYRCRGGRSFSAVFNAAGARVTAGRITATLPPARGEGQRYSDGSTEFSAGPQPMLSGLPGGPYTGCRPG
ncbi:MAG: S9 family peptidase [Proteobacteria bacterium]|nr:S9 family peptidase [Pseudomonadota bacterium]